MAYPTGDTPDTERPVALHSKRSRTAAQTTKLLKLARDRFKQADEADKNQRDRERDDLRFYAGDQWPDDIKSARAGITLGSGTNSIPVPARPCITIVGKVRKPVRQVLNQERSADMGIEIVAADDFGEIVDPINDEEIELREGLVRRIQRESQAADARTWAFSRAAIAGRGYYGILTRYAPGKTRDQEIYVRRFYDQSAVLGDPARQQPDGSDAEFWFVGSNVPWKRYVAEYGTRAKGQANSVVSCTDGEWLAMGEAQPTWFNGEGDMRTVRVVEYFYIEREPREVVTYQSPDRQQEITEWLDERPDAPDGWTEIERHTDIQKSIKWCKIDGCDDDVLDETDWPGPDMPIVQVLGEELHPYDEETRCEGMVRPMREPCQGNNAMISKFVEMVAMTPVPTLMMAAGQQEGFEEWYKAATTRTLPYLLHNQTDVNDRPAPQPFAPANRDMPIAPVATGLQMFDAAIQDSSIADPAMGQSDATVKSAKHAALLREEASQGTSNYLDNLKRSMRYEAQIENNLLYPIYGRPGRIARLINGEGDEQKVIIGQPMVMQGGRPVAAQPGDQGAKQYTLTKDARFNTAIKISKDFDTRRQQEAATLGELLGAAPQLMTVFGDLYFKNQDGPGHTEMAERMKVMLDPKVLQLIESKKQGQEPPSPELQQAQQQIQQLTQVAQQMQQQLQTDAVKQQAETQRAAAETQAKVQIEQYKSQASMAETRMNNLTKLLLEEYKMRGAQAQAEMDAQQTVLGARLQSAQDGDERAFQSNEAAQGRQHEAGQAAEGRQHESVEAAASREAASVEAERARQAQAEQAAMAAQEPQA